MQIARGQGPNGPPAQSPARRDGQAIARSKVKGVAPLSLSKTPKRDAFSPRST